VNSTVSQQFGKAALRRVAMSRRMECAAAVSMREIRRDQHVDLDKRARPTLAT
jgi:hypothetical protein